jgi:bacteriocin biosynthesis cyclodehydratase domain-containing protein
MLSFPRLKTFLSVFPLTATTWGLRGGGDELWRIKLTDARAVRAFSALLPYLNGRTSTDDILRLVESDGCHRGAATAVLRQLEAAFLLEEAGDDGLSEADVRTFEDQIRFFSRFGQQGGAKLQSVLRSSLVALAADGAIGQSMYGRLAGAGFGRVTVLSRELAHAASWVEHTPEPRPTTTVLELDAEMVWPETIDVPRLLIVCEDAHDPRLLEAVDAWSKRRRVPWLLVRQLDVEEAWVGPLFVPGETASYLSLEARLRANMPNVAEYVAFDTHVRSTERRASRQGGLHATFDLVTSVAVIEAIKFVTEVNVPQLLGRFLTINLSTWETELHDVLRVPALDRRDASRPPVFSWKVTSDAHGAGTTGRA